MELDQALFGYDRGHRLIASSRKLGKEATWVLRNVTDMKVPKRNGHYLTVLPVPEIDAHAFIRTWAAGGEFRPGSVWSHALLVRGSDLDMIDDLRVLLPMFVRPSLDEPEKIGTLKSSYGKKLKIGDTPTIAGNEHVDRGVLDRLVLAAYGTHAYPAEVVVDDGRDFETVILGLMSQRWSHLRRRFSARTRYRPSKSSAAAFELEVVERGSGASEPAGELIPTWASALSADLLHSDQQLRLFLRTYTREPDDQPVAIAQITDVYVAAAQSPDAGVRALTQYFPHPRDRSELKRDMFGALPASAPVSPTWPAADPQRLKLLLGAPGHAFALHDYEVGTRLAVWAAKAPFDAALAIVNSDITSRSEEDVNELVVGIADGFETAWVGKLVGTLPTLAPSLLATRPDVWCSPEIWTTEVDHRLLLDLIFQADKEQQSDTYLGLLSNGLATSASELLAHDPTLWWAIVEPGHAARAARDHRILSCARRLALSVTDARGPSPWPLDTLDQTKVIASVADPDEGLWRGIDAGLWIETYTSGFEPNSDDMYGPIRRDVMALAAGEAAEDPAARRMLWSLAFGRLHRSLLGAGTPLGCERTLAAVLPDGPSWDWCGRLRYGLARTAVNDNWSATELQSVAIGAGDFVSDVFAAADAFKRRGNRSIVDAAVDLFTTWWR